MGRVLIGVWLCGVLAGAGPAWAQTVLYVYGDLGTGADNGASWADAFRGRKALQRALAAAGQAAVPGGPMVEIWVARGTYVPGPAPVTGPYPLVMSFELRSRVQLYGGFFGYETARAQRHPWLNATVLSGLLEDGRRVRQVVNTSGTDASCVLDGFVITEGHATGEVSRGGGIYNAGGSPIIRNCVITKNRVGYGPTGQFPEGGGVYTSWGSPKFVACKFIDNVGGRGAGLFGNATLIDCLFEGNTGVGLDGVGGGVMGDCLIQRCTFRRNFAEFGAGGAHGSGTIEDCVFEDNEGGHGDAALLGDFAVVRSQFRSNGESASADSFTDCAWSGVGLETEVRGRVFFRCRLGGVWSTSIGERAENCVIASFRVMLSDGAAVTNCTLLGGGPLTIIGGGTGTVTNCILWRAGPTLEQQINTGSGQFHVNRSCVRGWDGTLGGVGNFGADPMLDAEGRLMPLSPCIDAGDNSALTAGSVVDVLGQPRRRDDPGMPNTGVGVPPVDIGAFEFQGVSCYPNCDGSAVSPVLNVGDLTCFLERFTQGHPYANCDASAAPPVLNIADFVCFLQRFQEGCE